MKEFTKKDIKEIRILLVVLAVLFGIIGVMAIIEKTHPGTIDTETQTSEIHTIEDESITEKNSVEETSRVEVSASATVTNDNLVLTVDNCEELKAMLTSDYDRDSSFAEFSKKHYGATIEFDGSIDYKDNYLIYNPFNGKTKVSEYAYDILLSAGDYSDSEQDGPTFKMENIRSADVGGDAISKSLPAFMSIGSNVRIRAEVGSYNEDTGIFELSLISIEER